MWLYYHILTNEIHTILFWVSEKIIFFAGFRRKMNLADTELLVFAFMSKIYVWYLDLKHGLVNHDDGNAW